MKSFELFPKRFGWIPYVFLCYLALPISHVFLETGGKRILGIVLIAVFLVAYREAYKTSSDRWLMGWSAIQLMVILMLAGFYQPYNLLLAFYISNFIGWVEDARLFRTSMVVFGLSLCGFGVLFTTTFGWESAFFAFPFIIVMALTPMAIRNNAKRSLLEEQLDEANERIRELSRQEERVRIARDLHDTLGHTLSLITLKSQVVQRVRFDPDRVVEEAKGIEETSRSALMQVRELVTDMRGSTIEAELIDMGALLSAAGIELSIEGTEELPELTPLKQNIVAMCVREAATNVARHSGAKHCEVSISLNENGLTVQIVDDGRGMENAEWGNGLNGMRERLALIDANLAIINQRGTQFELRIPIPITAKGVVVG